MSEARQASGAVLPWIVGLVLAAATLGAGGAEPGTLLAWHGLTVLALLGVLFAPRPRGDSLAPLPLLGFGVFAAVAVVGALFAPYAYAAWLFLLELAAFLAVAALAARCGTGLTSKLATPLLAVAAVQGLYALWQRFIAGAPRPAGTFLNPNHLGGWLVAVLLLAWGAWLASPGRRARPATLLKIGLTLPAAAALVLSASRGALVGLAGGGLALGICLWPRLPVRPRRVAAALTIGLFVVLCGWVVAQRLRESDPFRYQRLRIWRASFQAVVDSPWLGTGPRQFAFAASNLKFPDGHGPLSYDRRFSTPHSDLLRVPCELGWPGTLALLFAAGATLHVVRRKRRRGELEAAAAGAIAACLALAAHATVDDLSQRPALYLLAAALLGALVAQSGGTPGRLGWPARIGLAGLLSMVFGVGDVAPYLAWREVRELPRGRLDAEGRTRLDRALELNAMHPDYWRRAAEHRIGEGSEEDLDTYVAAREAAERAARLNPADARSLRVQARVESWGCRKLFRDVASRERTRARYLDAERLARFDPFIPLELAGFLLDTEAPDEARRAAERALALEPEAVRPRLLLAEALIAAGSPELSDQAARLLREARQKAERWQPFADESLYSRELLRLDERVLLKLEGQIAERGAPVADSAVPAAGSRSRP